MKPKTKYDLKLTVIMIIFILFIYGMIILSDYINSF